MIVHIINIIIFSILIISSILTCIGLTCVLFNQECFDYFVHHDNPENEDPKDAAIRYLAKHAVWDEVILALFWIIGLIASIYTM